MRSHEAAPRESSARPDAIHLGQETPLMTRYERVQQILDESIGGPDTQIGVHGAFWRGKTRDAFVAMLVRNRR